MCSFRIKQNKGSKLKRHQECTFADNLLKATERTVIPTTSKKNIVIIKNTVKIKQPAANGLHQGN